MMITHQPKALPRSACNCGTLRKASRRISQLYDAALAPIGLKSTQFAILDEIRRAGTVRSLTLCELAAAMVMDRSTLGHNLRPLQRDHLLVLRLATGDRRKRYLELTAEGKLALRRGRTLWRRAESRFEEALGRRPAAQLRAVLHRLATHEFDEDT